MSHGGEQGNSPRPSSEPDTGRDVGLRGSVTKTFIVDLTVNLASTESTAAVMTDSVLESIGVGADAGVLVNSGKAPTIA